MSSSAISSSFFIRNRQKLKDMLPPFSVVVLDSGKAPVRTADQLYPFRPRSDFFYLTGETRPNSLFLFAPDHPEEALREVMLLTRPDSRFELWNGPVSGLEQSREFGGIQQQHWLAELPQVLRKVLNTSSGLYSDPYTREKLSLDASSLDPYTEKLRSTKSPEELEQIRKAIELTRKAFFRVMKKLEPGRMEFELEAELISEFIAGGANGHAFDPIIASGKNALVLHYIRNRDRCREGDLVLLDFGAEFNFYAADCSRTLPVNGRFSKRQRELYGACLRVFREIRKSMGPGKYFAEIQEDAGRLWEEEHIRLGLYSRSEARENRGPNALWKRYFPHGVTHSLGLDVHDPFDRKQRLLPGMVLTCEPGIYIPEEGTGIRLENDILVTEEGAVDLMEDIPIEAAEIEAMMNTD